MSWTCRVKPTLVAALGWLLVTGAAAPVFAAEAVVLGAGSSADLAIEPGEPDDPEPLTPQELEALAGPVALYPDELLAVVLAAATYPLQIVQAARYLDALEDDPELEPDPDWDESVVALLNYPEAVEKLDQDLDWTAALGEAVLEQEEELLAAVNSFRRKAYSAGNLASDRRQRVEVEEQLVRIRPADPAVIFVPYYQPALVHRPHLRKVYHYHSRPCPVYYYPYPAGHYLASRHFWGVTSAFGIAWHNRHLSIHLLDHRTHPYYGHDYAFRHYRYWRPRLLDHHHIRDRRDFRDQRRHRQLGYRDSGRGGDRYEAGSRWRRDDRLRTTRPDPGQPSQLEAPFGRPAAGTGLSRLHRYRDAGSSTRSAGPSVRSPRALTERHWRSSRAPGIRAESGRRESRVESRPRARTRALTPPAVRESRARPENRHRAEAPARAQRRMRADTPTNRVEARRSGTRSSGSQVKVRPH